MRHLDPQIGSQYDLIALAQDITPSDSIYDAIRYICRIVKEEQALSGVWLSPYVEEFREQSDVRQPDFGTHVVLKLLLKPPYFQPHGAGAGELGIPYTLTCLLRQIAQEWYMVRSVSRA